jgi:hypothetical protein
LREFQKLFPDIFVDESRKENDSWFKSSAAIEGFNDVRHNALVCSNWISGDERQWVHGGQEK